MKIAAYMRVSSEMQADRNGTAMQREKIERWVAANSGPDDTVEWFEDLAISGSKMDRPAFSAMRAKIDAGELDTVVSYDLSRLGRNTSGVLAFVESCAARGIRVVSLKEALDVNSAMGRFMVAVLSAVNELNRVMSAERTADGLRRKARTGARMGASASNLSFVVLPEIDQRNLARRYGAGESVAALHKEAGVNRVQVYRYAERFPEEFEAGRLSASTASAH